jgi:hypothetical protein
MRQDRSTPLTETAEEGGVRYPLASPGAEARHSGFSETAHCFGSLSHFRNDFGFQNFNFL